VNQKIAVLIVGAGPTGLNFAHLLAQYGIAHRIIDKKITPITTSNALVVHARSLEMWDSMGLADDALLRGKKIIGLTLNNLTRRIGRLSFSDANLATPFPFILGLPQAETEQLLTEHLVKKGTQIERGVSLVDFTQSETGVVAQLQRTDGKQETLLCDWLIAADGCHSSVRKKLALNFKGGAIPEKFIMMDAVISAGFDPDYFHATLSPKGPLVFAPLPQFTRIICSVTHDTGIKEFENPTVADFEYVIKQRARFSCKIDKPIWLSHFVTQHRLIDQYRHGRILLVGDSAHVHSPVGGQGMNTGMQDAFNLAWKLARVIQGRCDETVLDTYQRERHPVAEKVLSTTTQMTKMVTLNNPFLISIRNCLMQWILSFKAVQKALLNQLSELNIRYLPNIKRAPAVNLLDSEGKVIQLQQLCRGLNDKLLIFVGNKKTADILKWIDWANSHGADPIVISITARSFGLVSVYLDPLAKAHEAYARKAGGVCLVRPDQYLGKIGSHEKRIF